ncbi:MAG: hypothetical protein JO099_07600, partial [Acidobacteriia bacterium]|nr:hypothetical protein [Terriglobia bacterium]
MKLRPAVTLFLAIAVSAAPLAEKIPALIDASPAARNAFWGIEIVDLATGKTLFSRNATHLFTPA